MFSQPFQKLFSCLAIIFVGLVESRETSESERSTFRVMNIPKKQQAAMLSSFNIKVRPISPLCLLRLRRSLMFYLAKDHP